MRDAARRCAGVLGAMLLAAGPLACGLGEDRAESHLARAAELLAAGDDREALLELRAASQLRPDDRLLTLRVAEVAAAQGLVDAALEYYADAHALDPADDQTTLAYARLLIQLDPQRSAELVDGVLERDPNHVPALLVRADGRLAAGQVREARQLVERARALAPRDPEVDWSLAQVLEARARGIRARSGAAMRDRRALDAILEAYDRYADKGGERRVLAALGRARALGVWTGVREEAAEAWREAIEIAIAEGTPFEIEQVLGAAADHADGSGDRALERMALEQWVSVDPRAIGIWERLARVPDRTGADLRTATLERMLEHNRDDADAHVVYARHLGTTRGYGAAAAHLEGRLGGELDDAVLLAGLVELQHVHDRPRDAAATMARLSREHPDSPTTPLALARHQLAEDRYDDAAATLRSAVAARDDAETWRLLAVAEMKRQHYRDALAAVERASAASSGPAPENIRLKARIHMALGESRQAATALSQLSRFQPLAPADRLTMARAYYQSHGAIHGRPILEGLLRGPDPLPAAALELARWEMDNPNRRAAVRKHLERVHQRHPGNVAVLDALIRDDLASDRPRAALARVTRALSTRPRDGELFLARARVWMALGRPGDAVADAQRAVATGDAVADDAYEMLALIFMAWPDPQEPIRRIEQQLADGAAKPDDVALLARLHLQLGDRARARALYERALADGSRLALLKNDLAYLLAESGEDLDRALQLAREAANAPRESLAAADTLGYVYLQAGEYDAAFWQFRFVTQEASPPVAEYWYHLGLALMKLERPGDARNALAEALRLEPDYPAATRALRELDGGVGAGAPAARPS